MIARRSALALLASSWAGGGLAASRRGPNRDAASGAGDLEGTWTLGTFTEFQRPKDLNSLVLTPQQAESYEAPRRKLDGMLASKGEELGQPESEFNERGFALARVHGEIRASWITDPADGRIPYTAAAKARLGLDKDSPPADNYDNPEDLNGSTRCLTNSAAGAPMIGAPDANLFQIVQTRDHVAIVTEKYHEVRIVRLGADLRPNAQASTWIGDSVGRWQGQTLIIETQGLRRGDTRRGSGLVLSEHSRVVEQFTREGPDVLLYRFTVDDPTLFTRAWRGEMAFTKAPGRIFEFACHEGNYSLPGILAGARLEEQSAAKGK